MQSVCERETGNPAHCRCRRGLHTHGGLVIAALGCRFDRPPNSARLLSHHRRFTHPRRADDRRSCERAFVHRKRRHFAGDRAPCKAPRAGGVSPPWGAVRMRARNGKSRTLPLQTRFAHPRRAGDCRSRLPIRSSPNSARLLSHDRRFTHPRRADDRRSGSPFADRLWFCSRRSVVGLIAKLR
jgi:hypothetical protein